MADRTIVFCSGLSLVVYLALAGGTVVAQDAPRTELGRRLVENHGDGAFHRLEEVKLRPAVAYPDATAFFGLKTPTAAYHAYLAGLRAVEEEASVTTMLVNNVLRRTTPRSPRGLAHQTLLRLGHRGVEALPELAGVGGGGGERNE